MKEEILIKNIVPGFSLVRYGYYLAFTEDGNMVFQWPEHLTITDPLFDTFDMANKIVIPEDDPRCKKRWDFFYAVCEFNKYLECHPKIGYKLITECVKQGYNVERHGTEIAFWLLGYIANKLNQRSNQ